MEEQKLKDPINKVSLIKGKNTLLLLSFYSYLLKCSELKYSALLSL